MTTTGSPPTTGFDTLETYKAEVEAGEVDDYSAYYIIDTDRWIAKYPDISVFLETDDEVTLQDDADELQYERDTPALVVSLGEPATVDPCAGIQTLSFKSQNLNAFGTDVDDEYTLIIPAVEYADLGQSDAELATGNIEVPDIQ